MTVSYCRHISRTLTTIRAEQTSKTAFSCSKPRRIISLQRTVCGFIYETVRNCQVLTCIAFSCPAQFYARSTMSRFVCESSNDQTIPGHKRVTQSRSPVHCCPCLYTVVHACMCLLTSLDICGPLLTQPAAEFCHTIASRREVSALVRLNHTQQEKNYEHMDAFGHSCTHLCAYRHARAKAGKGFTAADHLAQRMLFPTAFAGNEPKSQRAHSVANWIRSDERRGMPAS